MTTFVVMTHSNEYRVWSDIEGEQEYEDQFEAKARMIELANEDKGTVYGVMCYPGYSPARSRMPYVLYRSDDL